MGSIRQPSKIPPTHSVKMARDPLTTPPTTSPIIKTKQKIMARTSCRRALSPEATTTEFACVGVRDSDRLEGSISR